MFISLVNIYYIIFKSLKSPFRTIIIFTNILKNIKQFYNLYNYGLINIKFILFYI